MRQRSGGSNDFVEEEKEIHAVAAWMNFYIEITVIYIQNDGYSAKRKCMQQQYEICYAADVNDKNIEMNLLKIFTYLSSKYKVLNSKHANKRTISNDHERTRNKETTYVTWVV